MDFLDNFVVGPQSDEFIPQEQEDPWVDAVWDAFIKGELKTDL